MLTNKVFLSQSPLLPPLILILLLFFAVFSSTKVEGESSFEIQQRDKVLILPGQSFNVSFAHYSGYVSVNEEPGRALFYWFFEAAEEPDSKPLVLWLNGVANILFLDSPVGVGFSYSNDSKDLWNNGDASTAKDSLEFLKKWFEQFPQYKGRDFYLSGESYAGHYVPQLAQAIVSYHQLTGDISINLKGFLVGNALTDDFYDHHGIFQFMWVTGLISDETYKLLTILCDNQSFVHMSQKCEHMLDVASDELGNIDPYSIFTPSCPGTITFSRNKLIKRMRSGKMSEKYDPCTEKHSTIYFNLPEVKDAIHLNPSFAPSKWETRSDIVNENWKDCNFYPAYI